MIAGGAGFWSLGESSWGSGRILEAGKTAHASPIAIVDKLINIGGSLGAGYGCLLAEFQDSQYRGSRSDVKDLGFIEERGDG